MRTKKVADGFTINVKSQKEELDDVSCDDDVDEADKPKLTYQECIRFRRDLAEQTTDVKPVSLFGLFRFATSFDKVLAVIGATCAILTGIAQPAVMMVGGKLNNILLTIDPRDPRFRSESFLYIYVYLGFGIVCFAMNYAQFICFQTISCRVIARMRHEYIRGVLRQNAGWFDRNHSGILTTRLNDNIERIREGIGDKLGLLIKGASMFVTSLVISFTYEWRVALVMLGVSPCSAFLMSQLSQKMSAATKKELKGVAKAGAVAEESILGIRTVQSCNGQEEMVQKYKSELLKGRAYGVRKALWNGFIGGAFFFVLMTFLGAGLLYGGYLVKIGIFEKPGDLFAVVFAMLVGAYFLGVVSPHLMVLLNARVAASTIYQVIDRNPKIDIYSPSGISMPEGQGRIVFKDVHFRYPTRKEVKVLNGLNLVIEPGQVVAFVGHSGCGKSTTIGLLTRLYEAESGNVTIDGQNVRNLNLDWLRNIIGIVQQEPVLFSDTVEGNLRMGNPDAEMDSLVKACRMANAHNFIKSLPKGYQTFIGDGGVQLSGGQKQRIAIARALVRDPKILLLDEATSALDAHSEAVVQSALKNASKGRTTIMIAHRLSTVRNADKIVVFDKGVIAEEGKHSELVESGGIYSELVKSQQFKPEPEITEDSIPEEEQICGVIVAIICGLHLPASSLMITYVFKAFEQSDYERTLMNKLVIAFVMYACVGFAIMLTQFGSTALFGLVSENMVVRLRVRAFRSILMQDAAYFDDPKHSPCRLITRLASDAPKIKAVGLCGTAFVALVGGTQIFLAFKIQRINRSLIKNDNALKLAVEIIENVQTIQLLTRTDHFNNKYQTYSNCQKKSEITKAYYEALNYAVSQSFRYYMLAATSAVSVHCASTGLVYIGDSFNSTVSTMLAAMGVVYTAVFFPEIVTAHSAAGTLFEIIKRPPKTGDHMDGEKPEIKGRISFENVNFVYPQRPRQPVMTGINFEIKPGQTVALVGPSGCGKSTAISLLERFYDVASGSVRFDNNDVKKISLRYLRTQVALVGQEPRLFAGSIRNNICLGLEKEIPTNQLFEVLELANAKSFVQGLPQGLDTDVGEKGTQLSGGQKQRVAIARAIVRDPKILLLDEATSALDSESERAVQEALDKVSKGRTCIIIAHRLSSIQNADVIIYIENGKVREIGDHKALMVQKGRYYDLIKQQDFTS
uniref:ABC transmembrane type-1 domain-containing protein n=1 Tax=Syphacia muris TaxID=451379 RepID=A0A0N5AUE7_9BILA